MNLKQYHRYSVHFSGKWAKAALISMGISLFLLTVYYFCFRSIDSIGFAECLFSLILPIVICIGFIALIRIIRLNSPGIFAIMGAALCILLLIGTFSSGSILRILLACIWYPLSALVLIACAGGFLPGKLPASIMFAVMLVARVLLFTLHLRGASAMVYEISELCMIISLFCLPMMFRSGKKPA